MAPALRSRSSLLPLPDVSAPPVFRPHSGQPLRDVRRGRRLAALALAGALGVPSALWLASPRGEPTGARAEPSVAAPPAPHVPVAPAAPSPELLTSRTVLVESQPSGAVVSLGGQVLGVTPLSTLLPVGTQQLSVAKEGFASELAFVQLDPAPAGAKAVRTRVILRAAPPEEPPRASLPAPDPSPPAARAARPAPRRAPARRVEAPRTSAEPPPERAEAAVTPAPRPASAPLVDEGRVRLLEERPRARILE
jgi:hypothetical protein